MRRRMMVLIGMSAALGLIGGVIGAPTESTEGGSS